MKLYPQRYSPYARKVQVLLDLLGARHDLVEVPYRQRDELARVTGGYIYVPVPVDDDGKGVVESRDICEYLLAQAGGRLVPSPWEGGKETGSRSVPNEKFVGRCGTCVVVVGDVDVNGDGDDGFSGKAASAWRRCAQ